MKHTATIISFLLFCLCSVMAETRIYPQTETRQQTPSTLIVFDVHGKVEAIIKKKSVPLEKRDSLSLTDRISIPENGLIKLIDKEGRKMYTLKNKCYGKISELIQSQKQASKDLSKQYFAYVMRSLTRTDTDAIYDTGLTTGTYRNDADSLLCDIDSLQDVVDSLQNVINMMTNDSVKKK